MAATALTLLPLVLLPGVAFAGGSYGGVSGISIPSIPGPGLDTDCLRQQKNTSDAEAARRVHQCSKPYQPGPNGDARLQPPHPPAHDAKTVNTSKPASNTTP